MEWAHGRHARVETAREDLTGNEAITNVMSERKRTWRMANGSMDYLPGGRRAPAPWFLAVQGQGPAAYEHNDWSGAVD